MNKQQKEINFYKKKFWIAWILGITWVILSLIFIVIIDKESYEQGFQDGQANCKGINNYHYDLKCYIPLESGNYSVDNEGIIHTPSGRNIKCDEVRK